MSLSSKQLRGIIPPLPTPMQPDGRRADVDAFARLVEFSISAGVHGLWILGTTARFDLVSDEDQRVLAETAARVARGRLPLVLNVSDMGTQRTIERARRCDDLPYDYYAALPPWYLPMSVAEVVDYYHKLADELARPVVIYNAPWVCNQLPFKEVRRLAEHPRIVGCKDVGPHVGRALEWPRAERAQLGFSYLHAHDLVAISADLETDGFVTALADPFPELAVATWNAAVGGDAARAFRLQSQLSRLSQATQLGAYLGCVDVACRYRKLFESMLPQPLRALDPETAKRVVAVLDAVGVVPV